MGKVTKVEPADIVVELSGEIAANRKFGTTEAIVMGAMRSHLNWALCNTGPKLYKNIVVDIFISPERIIKSGEESNLDIKLVVREELENPLQRRINKLEELINGETWFSGLLTVIYRSEKSFESMCFSI